MQYRLAALPKGLKKRLQQIIHITAKSPGGKAAFKKYLIA